MNINNFGEEVVAERKICYYSTFDLNVNDWFTEYENIKIFQQNVKSKLGKLWLSYLAQVIKTNSQAMPQQHAPSTIPGQNQDNEYLQMLLECFQLEIAADSQNQIFEQVEGEVVTQELGITSSDYYLTLLNQQPNTDHVNNINTHTSGFDFFYERACYWLATVGDYEIVDESTFKTLIHTFYYVAMKERENIIKKEKADERFQIAQLTEKALARHNRARKYKKAKKVVKKEEEKSGSLFKKAQWGLISSHFRSKKLPTVNEENSEMTINEKSNYQMMDLIPGFSIIKNKVISPLLVATEKVVEYFLPESNQNHDDKTTSTDMISDERTTQATYSLPEQFNSMQLNENERERMKRKRRFNQLSRDVEESQDQFGLDEEFFSLAQDCIDFATKKRKITEQITNQFVTNIIELNENAINKLRGNTLEANISQEQQMHLNLRFIRPSKDFYNKLISVWLRFDKNRLSTLSFDDYLQLVKRHIDVSQQQINLHIKPIEQFFFIAKTTWVQLSGRSSNGEVSIPSFFNTIKTELFRMWNDQIIEKSRSFTQTTTQ